MSGCKREIASLVCPRYGVAVSRVEAGLVLVGLCRLCVTLALTKVSWNFYTGGKSRRKRRGCGQKAFFPTYINFNVAQAI